MKLWDVFEAVFVQGRIRVQVWEGDDYMVLYEGEADDFDGDDLDPSVWDSEVDYVYAIDGYLVFEMKA